MAGKGITAEALLASVFGDEQGPTRVAWAEWIASSRPFREFFEANAGKIRRKARLANDDQSRRDLWLELDTARRLLADRRVSLAYERFLAEKTRGPDFTVTYKGHLVFNVEVRRLRAPVSEAKLGEVVCDKLGQMPPGAINVLLVGVDADSSPGPLDVSATMKLLLQRGEAKQDDYFAQRGFRDARDFLRDLLRLSAVALRPAWDVARDAPPSWTVLWLNPQARRPLPPDARKLLGE